MEYLGISVRWTRLSTLSLRSENLSATDLLIKSLLAMSLLALILFARYYSDLRSHALDSA